MQPDAQTRQAPGAIDGVGTRGRPNHQARRGQNTVAMSGFYGLIDGHGDAEVVGGDDQIAPLMSRGRA
jgi:hypothetical protein